MLVDGVGGHWIWFGLFQPLLSDLIPFGLVFHLLVSLLLSENMVVLSS